MEFPYVLVLYHYSNDSREFDCIRIMNKEVIQEISWVEAKISEEPSKYATLNAQVTYLRSNCHV